LLSFGGEGKEDIDKEYQNRKDRNSQYKENRISNIKD
jgi:hypothetical protein